MSVSAILSKGPQTCSRHLQQYAQAQPGCSTSGRLCHTLTHRACIFKLHLLSPSGRRSSSVVSKKQRHALRNRTVVSASFKPYPYSQQDYHQVKLLLVAEAPDARRLGAVFLQRMDELGEKADTEHLLVLQVGGDSLSAILSMQERNPMPRPVALHLLWKVLQRGQSISKRDWKLIRVAIVDMQSFTYIGRLFFGNQETGEVAWDCDCRPSDGMWLAQQAECPLYVHKRVWADHKSQAREVIQGDDETARFLLGQAKEPEDLSGTNAFTTIRNDDPEPVKRLKREMAVALSEEDYTSAARIRDHPFMKLAVQIIEERLAGRESQAEALQEELQKVVQAQQ